MINISVLFKYGRTLSYLQLSQLVWRLRKTTFTPYLCREVTCTRNTGFTGLGIGGKSCVSPPQKNQICFLNHCADISFPDIWNDQKHSMLWLYNLHYFDFLKHPQSVEHKTDMERLVVRWIKENPPIKGIGWQPYPTSRRIVNWINWILITKNDNPYIIESLFLQTRWLRKNVEWDIRANHLLANAKALFFAGLFFAGDEANSWWEFSKNLMEEQVREQVLEDGGHFELSPMYHLLVLEDLIDVLEITLMNNPSDRPITLISSISNMLTWATIMLHPDGRFPFFNDAAFGISSPVKEIFNRSKALKIPYKDESSINKKHLKDSGFVKLKNGKALLFADVGMVGATSQPGHAHADTLSFEMSLGKKRFIVNGGTSTYEFGCRRKIERSTGNHNTLRVDELDSSEVWAQFRVGRRAGVTDVILDHNEDVYRLSARHNGYMYLPGRIVHQRRWTLAKTTLEIQDTIQGKKESLIEVFFLLHPNMIGTKISCSEIAISSKDHCFNTVMFFVSGHTDLSLENYFWCPEFGIRIEATKIKVSFSGHLPRVITSQFSW